MTNSRLEQLLKFLEESPEDPFVLYAIATEYVKTDEQMALHYYERLITEHEEYIPTYYHLANLYIELHEDDKAEKTFQKGLEIAKGQEETKLYQELQTAYNNFLLENE